MVEFFVHSFYEKVVSPFVSTQLDSISSENILRLKLDCEIKNGNELDLELTSNDLGKSGFITDLNEFYQETKSISLMSEKFPEAVKSLESLKRELGSTNPLRLCFIFFLMPDYES